MQLRFMQLFRLLILLSTCTVLSVDAQATTLAAALTTFPTQPLPRELGKPEDEDISINITRYEVDGLPTLDTATLQSLTIPFVGKNRGYEDLMNAAAAVTRYMQATLGYYVGFAYVPAQTQSQGIVKLQAIEGRLDSVEVQVAEGPRSEDYRRMIWQRLEPFKSGIPLYTAEVERTVLLLNDIPGLEIRVALEPGQYLGTVKFKVSANTYQRNHVNLSLDSRGTHSSGRYRTSADYSSAGVLTAGDMVNVALSTSQTGDFKQATLGYTLPVGTQGWKVGAVASQVNYRAETSLWGWQYSSKGTVNIAGAYALYPLIRSRDLNTFGVVTYQNKRLSDQTSTNDQRKKSSNGVIFSLVGDIRDSLWGGGITTYSAQLAWGSIDYGRILTNTDSNFSKLNWSVGRLQNIVPKRFQLYAKFQGQASNSRLDNSEYFVGGGYNAVRAFESGTAAGNQGYLVNAELRWLPSTELLGAIARELRFSIFYDWAKINVGANAPWAYNSQTWSRHKQNRYTLSGYGIGATWESSKNISLHVNVAWRQHQDIANFSDKHSSLFNFSLSKRF